MAGRPDIDENQVTSEATTEAPEAAQTTSTDSTDAGYQETGATTETTTQEPAAEAQDAQPTEAGEQPQEAVEADLATPEQVQEHVPSKLGAAIADIEAGFAHQIDQIANEQTREALTQSAKVAQQLKGSNGETVLVSNQGVTGTNAEGAQTRTFAYSVEPHAGESARVGLLEVRVGDEVAADAAYNFEQARGTITQELGIEPDKIGDVFTKAPQTDFSDRAKDSSHTVATYNFDESEGTQQTFNKAWIDSKEGAQNKIVAAQRSALTDKAISGAAEALGGQPTQPEPVVEPVVPETASPQAPEPIVNDMPEAPTPPPSPTAPPEPAPVI